MHQFDPVNYINMYLLYKQFLILRSYSYRVKLLVFFLLWSSDKGTEFGLPVGNVDKNSWFVPGGRGINYEVSLSLYLDSVAFLK